MNPINDEDEVSYPTPEWSGFRKESDKMSSLSVSQARMINHQARGICTSSVESLLAAKGERVLLMDVCCSPESLLSAEVERLHRPAVRITASDVNMAVPNGGPELVGRLRQDTPRYAWFSVPCGPYSLLTQLRSAKRTLTQERHLLRNRQAVRRMVRNSIDGMEEQLRLNGYSVFEWPRSNLGWSEIPELYEFIVRHRNILYFADGNGCRVGAERT